MVVALVTGLSASAVVLPPMQSPSPALLKMADTERAFARRAKETTVRQAFIDFFADESIAFEPDPVAARESMRKREALLGVSNRSVQHRALATAEVHAHAGVTRL